MTILERRGVMGHQGLKADQLEYLQLMRDRQVKAYDLVKQEDYLIKSKHEANNEDLEESLHRRPKWEVGDWVFVYDAKGTIMAGGNAVRDGGSSAISAKFSHSWKGPYKILVVGPGVSDKGELVGEKLLMLDIRKNEPGVIMSSRVSVLRCKRCYNPKDDPEPPKSLPWGLSQYVMNQYSELSPPLHLTEDDVSVQLDTYRMRPTKIVSHRISRGLGGKISVQYLVYGENMDRPR